MVALYKLALDWSLNSMILGRAVELSKGASLYNDRRMDQEAFSGISYIVLIFLVSGNQAYNQTYFF